MTEPRCPICYPAPWMALDDGTPPGEALRPEYCTERRHEVNALRARLEPPYVTEIRAKARLLWTAAPAPGDEETR